MAFQTNNRKKQGLNGWVILRSLNISLSFDEWIAQTAIFGRAKSERCSKVHDFQYPFVIFVKFLGCVRYAVEYAITMIGNCFSCMIPDQHAKSDYD